VARPRKVIDPEQVRKLAAIDCSYDEMAAIVGCNPSTLTRRFAQAIEKGRQEGCASLKRKQFETAMAGNPTMLIWLGKQRLGQTDKQQNSVTGPGGGPIQHAIVNILLPDNARGDRTQS
jgi:AraC-like DNA-binding protein